MSNTISFMSANFVARELNYRMTNGWGEGDTATQNFFRPEETFAERFDAMLAEVSGLGFTAIDLWTAQLSPAWATPRQIEEARRLLTKHNLRITSLAAWLPDDLELVEKTCRMARELDAKIIGAGCASILLNERRVDFLRFLEKYELVFGYENHPEKTPEEVLEKIGPDENGRIGVALDTGWFGTQQFDAAEAVKRLSSRIALVHLKDIHNPEKGFGPTLKAMGHETCALGDGVVPVEQCVSVLKTLGYEGGISIEHEPEHHNPLPEVQESFKRLKAWLNK
jgi:L-ribulose-5-phosphate 3-epimerase